MKQNIFRSKAAPYAVIALLCAAIISIDQRHRKRLLEYEGFIARMLNTEGYNAALLRQDAVDVSKLTEVSRETVREILEFSTKHEMNSEAMRIVLHYLREDYVEFSTGKSQLSKPTAEDIKGKIRDIEKERNYP